MTEARRGGLRADAEHNRARILSAARDALAASGGFAMNAIAHQAGVGQGTLYRHFPTREALVLAVYRQDVNELVEAAPALLTQHEPAQALGLWLDRLAAFGQVKHGLPGVLHAATRADLSGEYYGPVIGAIGTLLRAGQAAGTIRPDVEAEEVLLLLNFLWTGDRDPGWEQRSGHMLQVVLDGLRARD